MVTALMVTLLQFSGTRCSWEELSIVTSLTRRLVTLERASMLLLEPLVALSLRIPPPVMATLVVAPLVVMKVLDGALF